MINPMQNKTLEERRAIAAKAHATRRARIDAERAAKHESLKCAGELRQQIAELEDRLQALQRMEAMGAVSANLTAKMLLSAEEIARGALPWTRSCGVYFLLEGDEVVYVGQSVHVYSRIGQHTDKRFDRYAFVPCAAEKLDILESLYIHCLRPKLNGNQNNNAKCAPISLNDLIGLSSITKK